MAKIMDQEEQRKALKTINDSIKTMAEANDFLRAQNSSGIYTLSFKGDDGKRYNAEIHVDSKESIASFIMSYKEKEKARLIELGKAHRITIDEEDYEIMDFSL